MAKKDHLDNGFRIGPGWLTRGQIMRKLAEVAPMRRLFLAGWAFVMPGALILSAHDQAADPRSIIENAIQAEGGLEKLLSVEAAYRKVKGVFHSDNFAFIGESYSDKLRSKISYRGDKDHPQLHVMVIDQDKGWTSRDDLVIVFDAKLMARMRKGAYTDKVAGLVTLLRDQGYTLTPLGETKVSGSSALGVKVQRGGMPDISLYFDKATRLLVKSAYRLDDLETGKEFYQEVYYSRYEAIDPAAEPLDVLAAASQQSDDQSLLTLLEQRIPSNDELEKIDLLILELGRTAFSAREKASAALVKFGPKAAVPLRIALKSQDREVARRSEQILQQLGQSGESAFVTAAIRVLAVRQHPSAAETLLAYLPWAIDESVMLEAKFALASLVEASEKSGKLVKAATKNDNPLQRAAAAQVLGEDGGKFLKQPGRRVVVQGVRLAKEAHVFRDGKPYLDMATYDHVFYNRFDDALFERPR